MHQQILNNIKIQFSQAIDHLKVEISSLRTGRANPVLVENIEVECYGQSRLPLKQLAAINTPEPRMIYIQPWDKGLLKDIERAIINSGSGLNPVVDGDAIRLNLPPLTEERRREFVKILNQNQEEARIALRRYRDESWKEIQNLERDSKIREDDKFHAKDELQKLIDEYNGKIKEIGDAKEKEIMTV